MTETANLKKTALYAAHQKLGARLVEFGGWHMPVQYTGIVEEHKAVRETAGVFDISHMGEFFISGPRAQAFLDGLLTNDVAKLAVGQGQYTLMLNEAAGVIDDLIIYRLEDTTFFLVVNAAKIDEDRAWIESKLKAPSLDILRTTAAEAGVDVIEKIDTVPEEVVKAVPQQLAYRLGVMPIHLEGLHLRVALTSPFNFDAIDTLTKELRYDIDPVVASADQIELALKRHYGIAVELPSGVNFSDRSNSYSAVALQGPKALDIARAFLGAGWPEPKRNEITRYSWNCQEILAARTGYTGEDGIELFLANEIAENFLFALLEAGKPFGLKPTGLGARDTLRLEACLPLNGNDLSDKRTPLQAGLGIFVSLTKAADFPGKSLLLQQKAEGTAEKLVAFRLKDKGPPPRPHYSVYQGNDQVGEVTSGAPSPTLGYGIGLAYVKSGFTEPGTALELEVRGTRVPVEVVKKPFYKRKT